MNFSIDVDPQLSARLTEAARARGMDPVKLLESLVAEHLPPVVSSPGQGSPRHPYRTPEERVRAMDALAEKNAALPILPDSAFDRESIYEDRL